MRNVSDKSCKENQNTHFVFNNIYFFLKKRAVYEVTGGKKLVESGRSQMTIWHMRIACWIPKATNTHSGCVMLIAFPLQQWLQERASILRFTYIACLVSCDNLGLTAVGKAICHVSRNWVRWRQYTSSCSSLTMYSKCVTLLHPFVPAFLSSRPIYSIEKAKCTFIQVLRLCTGRTVHTGSRGIALLFLDHSTRRGWGVNFTSRSLFISRKDPVPIVREAGWASGPVWTGAENLAPTGIRYPDRPARSRSLYRLSYRAHVIVYA